MAGPFTFEEIVIVASGDDVAAFDIGIVNPVFVLQHLVITAAAKAAIENVIATVQSLAGAFTNDRGARAKLLAQDAEAADLRLGRDLPDDASDRCPVAEKVLA